jgi:hypothetical protein
MRAVLIAVALFSSLAAHAQGLRGEYFFNQFFTNAPYVRRDLSINFDWGTASPAPGVPTERFSVRWTGEIVPQFEEVYTFYTGSDDGIRLWINGQRLISNWSPHILTTNVASMFLKAGQRYRVQVDYYDLTVGAVASLAWSSLRQPYQIIPSTRLREPAVAFNSQPNIPIITLPLEGATVDAENFLMRTDPFSDPDWSNTHVATEWEIWNASFTERVWVARTSGTGLTRVRLNDGTFENSFAGRKSLRLHQTYILRVHHRDSSAWEDTGWSNSAERTFNTDQPLATLVMQGSVWKFNDSGVSQGSTWVQTNFVDSFWPSGAAQLGVGDGDETTVTCCAGGPRTTTYFRHSFVISNVVALTNPFVRLLRDDGGIVYINGSEVFRNNMPAGTPFYTMLALTSATEADEAWFFHTGAVPNGVLRNGTNVVAVEVHQNSAGSSDLSFDLELFGLHVEQPPELKIARNGNDCTVVTWNNPDALLERSSDINGPWSTVPNTTTSPYVDCDTQQKCFYRLRTAE